MRREKQVEAAVSSNRAKIYQRILAVWDELPDRFKAAELYALAAIPKANSLGRRMLVASVLAEDFKCIQICAPGNTNRHWKKPS